MNIKKKLGMSVATAALGLSLVAGGTFAYFSDTETTENSFASGTLKLGLSPGDEENATFSFENLKPGDVREAEIHLTNEGTLNIKDVTLDTNITGDTDLASQILVTASSKGSDEIVSNVLLENLVEMEEKLLAESLKPDQESVYNIKFEFKDTGKDDQNKFQGNKLGLEMVYKARQE